MTDEHARRLDDIEKRLKMLELIAFPEMRRGVSVSPSKGISLGEQWCECGRDVCRAPDCPSHRVDPMGR